MSEQQLGTRRNVSYYIRGSGSDWSGVRGGEQSALVKIWVDSDSTPEQIAHLATSEALEQGCMPSGTCIVYEVVEQDPFFYNRLWTEEDANNPDLRELAR